MTFFRAVSSLLLPCVVVLALGCGDDDDLLDPDTPNRVDTLSLGSLTGTPITTPSGYAVEKGEVRTDVDAGFDFAYNVEPSGARVFLPRAAVGLPSSTSADPGLQPREQAFDAIELAPSNGYTTDEPVPAELGRSYLVRSRVICSQGVPLYAKIEVLAFEGNLVTLKVLANENCGYKELLPGLPDR
jgi:hypothetical protein